MNPDVMSYSSKEQADARRRHEEMVMQQNVSRNAANQRSDASTENRAARRLAARAKKQK